MKNKETIETNDYQELLYHLNEDKTSAIVTGVPGYIKAIEIPSRIDNVPVTVAYQAFAFEPLESVIIRSGVVLNGAAFESCRNLQQVVLEPGVQFQSKPTLFQSVKSEGPNKNLGFKKIPLSHKPDAPRHWVECFEQGLTFNSRLKEGYSYQHMDNYSIFSSCELLTEIIIPEGVTLLPNYTFSDCPSLCSIRLPSTLKVIGSGCFSHCKNLVNIVIPEGVIAIGEEAFAGCARLETVVLPGTLTHIAGNPFKRCKSLKRIVIPEGMEGIDGRDILADEIYRYVSFFHVEAESFDKKELYSKKSWKQIFKEKPKKLITEEIPSQEELITLEKAALLFVKGQNEFDKQKEIVDGILAYFKENLASASYKKKDITNLRKQLITYVNALKTISKENYGDEGSILIEVRILVEYINIFSDRFHAIETEDRESLGMLIDQCALLAGYPFPEEDRYYDITEPWRRW